MEHGALIPSAALFGEQQAYRFALVHKYIRGVNGRLIYISLPYAGAQERYAYVAIHEPLAGHGMQVAPLYLFRVLYPDLSFRNRSQVAIGARR